MKDWLIELAKQHPIRDIMIAGFVDPEESPPRFHPMLSSMYIDFDGTLVRFTSVEQSSHLDFGQVEIPRPDFEVEEGTMFCVSSVTSLLLNATYAPSLVRGIEAGISAVPGANGPVVRCLGFDLERDEYVFLDPWNHFGVRVTNRLQRDAWFAEHRDVVVDRWI